MTAVQIESVIGEKGHLLKQITEQILNLIYPRRCPLCQKVLKDQSLLVCPKCMRTLSPIREPKCKRCGRPVEEDREYCPDCEKGRSFREGRGIFLYGERMKRSLLAYKYGGQREYGAFFARALCIYGEKEIRGWKPDLIVPVPMHKSKQRKRGFNQAEDLALRVGQAFGIPVATHLVKKTVSTRSQKRLDAAARKQNLRHAFTLYGETTGLRILVIDDIFTTGSTIEAAAETLKSGGAADVFFLTVAIGYYSS